MKGIIDFHTHAFPDELAVRAMEHLKEEGDIEAYHDGTVAGLVERLDENGIEKAVVCSIATRPKQFDPILDWSRKIRSQRIIPFPSVHPADPDAPAKVDVIKSEGFKGVKMHPYYQQFDIDERRLDPIYERIRDAGLLLVVHTGYDLAFEFIRRGDPVRIVKVLERFPGLKFITTHLGAWKDWEQVEKYILGKNIYMDTSFALEVMDFEQGKRILNNHPAQYLLFGTDSPWTEHAEAIRLVKNAGLGEQAEKMIFRENALKLLGSVGC